jgi:hypothetical protein
MHVTDIVSIKELALILNIIGQCDVIVRPKKNICVFTVPCQKNLGSVGINFFFFFFIIDKTGNSR